MSGPETLDEIGRQQRAALALLGEVRARGRTNRPRRSGMNKTEEQYAANLRLRVLAGEVRDFVFEGLKFRLADGCWYVADFVLLMPDGGIQIHEVKGHMEDDAAVKLRVMPEAWWWFRLFVVRRSRDGWQIEERTR